MKRFLSTLPLIAALIAVLILAPSTGADHESTPEASPMAGEGGHGMTGTGAAYMTIANAGGEADRLIAGESDVAEVVEIHEIVDVAGVMQMRPLGDGLELPAGGEVVLEPGGYHVMLIGLTRSLLAGDTFELTLEFAGAGEVTVPVVVQTAAPDESDDLTIGQVTISGAWSRPAPMLSATDATPEASPTS